MPIAPMPLSAAMRYKAGIRGKGRLVRSTPPTTPYCLTNRKAYIMSALLSAPATTSSVHKARGVASPTQVSYLERLGRVAADLCGLLAKETERLGHPELSVDQARPHPYDAGDPATLPSNVAWRASERLISVCETIIATAGSPVTRMTSMSMGFFDTSCELRDGIQHAGFFST